MRPSPTTSLTPIPTPTPRPSTTTPTPPATAPPPAPAPPLAPERLRIHPLTRVTTEATPDGPQQQIVCHLELKDRFGHSVKALGRLRVELYRPATADAGSPVSETQELIWDIDLRDPVENA